MKSENIYCIKSWGLSFFLLMFFLPGYAQVSITGELRPRFEFRNGYKSLMDTGQIGAAFTEQRTRLNFHYAGEKFKAGVSLQDIRVWGSQPQLNKSDGLTSIHEAWAEYKISGRFSAQLGRQELNYDDERLLGAGNWTQQGRSHDLLLLKYGDSTFTAHGGIAHNQTMELNTGSYYYLSNNYRDMQFVWLNAKFSYFNISLMAINKGQQSSASARSTRYSSTFGPNMEFRKAKWFASLRGYFQTGRDESARVMRAFMIGADVSYSPLQTLNLGVGGERYSGQSQTKTDKSYLEVNHSFNPLYGTGHKFNGYMDYFYVGNFANSVGLTDLYLKAKFKSGDWWIGLDMHEFLTSAGVLDMEEFIQTGKQEKMDAVLGTEADLTFGYALTTAVMLQAGYSQMLATKTMEAVKGGRSDKSNSWAYLMLTFKPTLFKN